MKKICKTALSSKIKEQREKGDECLIGAHIKYVGTLPFNCNNTTQDKKNARKALIDEDKGAY